MADSSGVRLLVFRVADLVCATDAATVRETMSVLPATRVPGAPEQVAGIVNVRGDVVTLVDGRRALGRPTTAAGGSIVLLDVGTRAIGFVVDEVIDLIAMSAHELADRRELPGIDPAAVRAVGRRADLSFVLLDFDALLRPIFAS